MTLCGTRQMSTARRSMACPKLLVSHDKNYFWLYWYDFLLCREHTFFYYFIFVLFHSFSWFWVWVMPRPYSMGEEDRCTTGLRNHCLKTGRVDNRQAPCFKYPEWWVSQLFLFINFFVLITSLFKKNLFWGISSLFWTVTYCSPWDKNRVQ